MLESIAVPVPREAVEPLPTKAPPGPAPARVPSPWRRSLLTALAVWFTAVLGYLVVNVLVGMPTDQHGPSLSHLLEVWLRWDSGHYLRIADVGYTTDRPDVPAFFPLYPLLILAVNAVLPGASFVASLVVSNLACIGALAVLHRFVAVEIDRSTAERAVFYLMAFPAGFFLVAGYNESLFLLLSVGALYRMRRGRWWSAGALAGLAGATRLAGVLLGLALVLEYLRQRNWRWREIDTSFLALGLVPLGLIAYSVYCWQALGDPFAFSTAQEIKWGRHISPPWTGVSQAAASVLNHPVLHTKAVHNLIDLAALAAITVLLVLAVRGPWRLRTDQMPLVIWSAANLLLLLISPVGGLFPQQGAPRYALEMVPAFLVLAKLGARRAVERAYLVPALAAQAMFLLTYFNNVWIS